MHLAESAKIEGGSYNINGCNFKSLSVEMPNAPYSSRYRAFKNRPIVKRITYILTIIIWTTLTSESFAQRIDSTQAIGGITRDTFYIIHENIPKSKFWGNSWYSGLSYNLSTSHDFTLNFGRTYGNSFVSGGGFNFAMKSWGIGYSYFQKESNKGQTISLFGEVSNFFLPPATGRIDYIYDFQNQNHYLRPSLGVGFFAIDILYGYSIKIIGDNNDFKHGLIIRFKYYLNSKNWQKNYPNRC